MSRVSTSHPPCKETPPLSCIHLFYLGKFVLLSSVNKSFIYFTKFCYKKQFFSQSYSETNQETKKLLGIRGHAPPQIFKNFGPVMAILVLFEQFLWLILFKFSAPYSESFTKYDASCSRISIYDCLV